MSDVAVVPGDPLLGSVDGEAGVRLLLDDGQGGGVRSGRLGGRLKIVSTLQHLTS